MNRLFRLALLLCLWSVLPAKTMVNTEHVQAQLIAHAPAGIVAGQDVRLGLLIRHQPEWHTYWRNPGDSGLATTLDWTLSPGVQAGEIAWPTPRRLRLGPLLNYGYEGQVLLPVSLTIPADFKADALDIRLRADWLVCRENCIPESGEFSLRLPSATPLIEHAALFDTARGQVPQEVPGARADARVDGASLAVEVEGLAAALHGQPLNFFAETGGVIDHAAAVEQQWRAGRWIAKVPLSPQRSESPATMAAVLTVGDRSPGTRLNLRISGPWSGTDTPASPAPLPAPSPASPPSLPFALLLALLGGLLLNLMPCVFPILSLKVLSFARPGQERRALLTGGLAYTVGIVVSFVALAGLLLALRAGGEELGWGFQLQSPLFVASLAAFFSLIGLNLAGVFELGNVLPSSVATLHSRHPVLDHALTGVLAVAVASPCTGPFMGVALGTALVLPVVQALLIFATLGLGMALPYLLASLWPGLARRLPRPGVWMVRFRTLMAFPMFATVVWLLWVLGQQIGIDGLAALLGILVALAFAAWAFGSPGFSRKARLGFGVPAALVLGGTLWWAWPSFASPSTSTETTGQTSWQAWSAGAVVSAQAAGRPVFIDFTAAWCVTCQFNKRTALADPAVLADFERRRVLLLRADWTRRDPAITQELARLGRSGVPVYALYSPAAKTPVLLPEILRPADLHGALASIESPA
ncbi:protein-disulfide reductase DsbD family protein [Chitinimonas lacunae]|uniref:Protein-disulfide reductase DsbD family protein n=1 Tax=Chitinimonas lacunae TaxID=1963018 RepID=A0ABV8MKR8_9NEIS